LYAPDKNSNKDHCQREWSNILPSHAYKGPKIFEQKTNYIDNVVMDLVLKHFSMGLQMVTLGASMLTYNSINLVVNSAILSKLHVYGIDSCLALLI
jgi:hypothetical protein